jgi:hypothetical protein
MTFESSTDSLVKLERREPGTVTQGVTLKEDRSQSLRQETTKLIYARSNGLLKAKDETDERKKSKQEVSMRQTLRYGSVFVALALMLAWPAAGAAQNVTGQASGVQATLMGTTVTFLGTTTTLPGTTTVLANTGTLSGINDARDASMDTGSVPSTLSAEVLSAGTISWPNEVDSYASLAYLNATVAGVAITADSVVAQASQVLGTAGGGTSYLDNLSINGMPITVTGAPNQTIGIPGGQVVINEQTVSSTGMAVVNALHVIVSGVANVVMASATAGIQ